MVLLKAQTTDKIMIGEPKSNPCRRTERFGTYEYRVWKKTAPSMPCKNMFTVASSKVP
jgi:hypothetical protein